MPRRYFALTLTAFASACGDDAARPTRSTEVATFVDLSPDPAVVEVELVAEQGEVELAHGKPAAVWAYRDGGRLGARATVPGPRLEAKRGDRIIVHFTNALPEATTIHWHGIRLPGAMDGTPASQLPIAAGATFTYEFVATDAGSFWYHPHVRADVQIERGLYGALVVTADEGVEVHADRTFVLDDVKLEDDGTLADDTSPMDLMMGRQGNLVVVNGVDDGALTVPAGARERWRFVNAANGRFFNLQLEGISFVVIGWDGSLLDAAYEASQVLISPGERYDVLITFPDEPGARLALESAPYDRGHAMPMHAHDDQAVTLLRVVTSDEGVAPLAQVPARLRTFTPLALDAQTPVRRMVLSETMGPAPRFFINGRAWPDQHDEVRGALNATEIWEVVNAADMDHPFHLHGMIFQVLSRGEAVEQRLAWKDTVLVPRNSSVRFALRYETAGTWMYHCHILEHAELGMMGMLHVE